ncbi:DNA-binding transcriptional LysR family regulator [Litorimonas taeanensis]|uniref:DNA-binding transcriptional LysR family regulator n=1 Tax=Litorimonas taeanensis TaxID=568099 RepID=A0A420WD45_9PROT|nr:LysR family transcriptional regulator [Litorimonas taeanensis]RKQ68850.1 DNA-binding transcriptional LysR family regulator [Litorimonas taeanensis]
MINATWLETFTTLCETEHFTQAAKRLNMTQPGVSQHLRKLEQYFGYPLISQDGKSFSLTQQGDAIFALGLSRRREEKQLRETIEADDPNIGEIRLACSGSFAMLLYPKLLPWMNTAPNLRIDLEAAPQTNILSGLIAGDYDLGVVSEKPNHSRIKAQALGREELCLLLPKSAIGINITYAELQRRGLVAHPDAYAFADKLLPLNFPNEYLGSNALRIRGYINQIGQIPTPVAAGIGYTILPRSGLEAFPHSKQLMVAKLDTPQSQNLWLISRKGRVMSSKLKRLIQTITETAEQITTI